MRSHFLSVPAPSAAQLAAKASLMASMPLWLLALKSLLIYPVVEECIYRGEFRRPAAPVPTAAAA